MFLKHVQMVKITSLKTTTKSINRVQMCQKKFKKKLKLWWFKKKNIMTKYSHFFFHILENFPKIKPYVIQNKINNGLIMKKRNN